MAEATPSGERLTGDVRSTYCADSAAACDCQQELGALNCDCKEDHLSCCQNASEFSCQYRGLVCDGPVECRRTGDSATVCQTNLTQAVVVLRIVFEGGKSCDVITCSGDITSAHQRRPQHARQGHYERSICDLSSELLCDCATMFTVSSTLIRAALTHPIDWVCHIGTLTPTNPICWMLRCA